VPEYSEEHKLITDLDHPANKLILPIIIEGKMRKEGGQQIAAKCLKSLQTYGYIRDSIPTFPAKAISLQPKQSMAGQGNHAKKEYIEKNMNTPIGVLARDMRRLGLYHVSRSEREIKLSIEKITARIKKERGE